MFEEFEANEERIDILKFRADRAYSVANYERALTLYEQISSRRGPPQLLRDATEAIVRCNLRLGNLDEALTMAKEMSNLSKNIDHKTCSWMLLARVYHHCKDYSNEIETVVNLIQFHPLNANCWLQFAEAFSCHWGVSTAESLPSAIACSTKPCEESLLYGLNINLVYHIIGTCYLRVRAIYESFTRHSQTCWLSGNSRLKEQADKWLATLPLTKDFQQTALQNSCKDIFGENEDSEDFSDHKATETEELSTTDELHSGISSDQFYATWFGWIKPYLGACTQDLCNV